MDEWRQIRIRLEREARRIRRMRTATCDDCGAPMLLDTKSPGCKACKHEDFVFGEVLPARHVRSGDCTMTTSDFYYKVAVEEVREWELRRAQFTLFASDRDEQREYTRALDRLKGYKELRRAGAMDNVRVTVLDAIRRATDTPAA